MSDSDAVLVRRSLAGDSQSFTELIRRYQSMVQGFAYHLIGNFEDAQDTTQEVFVAAYLKLHQLQQPEKFAAWLRQITFNSCQMWLRRARKTEPLDETIAESHAGARVPSPAEEYEQQETRALVHRALGQLTEKNRLVLILYHLDGLSYADIAHFLDVPVTTVEGRMHRARKQLKERLRPMVEDSLQKEKLPDDFAQKVVEEALARAREAQKQWARESFAESCQDALNAVEQLPDTAERAKRQIEVLSILAEAGTTWLGTPERAIQNYTSALELARQQRDKAEEARILKRLFIAHARHGDYKSMKRRAQQALPLFAELGDSTQQALTRAALDLAGMLPDTWRPGEAGGYVMAVFPIESNDEGLVFQPPESVRHYSWGCPSRCTALAHLLGPMRILGDQLHVGAIWEDRIGQEDRYGLRWSLPPDPELVAASVVESDSDRVVTPAGTFEKCLRVKTTIKPPEQDTAGDFVERSYSGTRLAWFAPGVGWVKLRHEDQNSTLWFVHLVEYHGQEGDAYLPLTEGAMWRYHSQMSVEYSKGRFEDICRVVRVEGNIAYLSSATTAFEPPETEIAAYFESLLECEKQAGDLAGQAAAIGTLIEWLKDDDQRSAYPEQLVALYESLGDPWKKLDARWRLRGVGRELSLEEQLQRNREKVELARQVGDRYQEGWALWHLAASHQTAQDAEQAIECWQQAAGIFRELHDSENVTGCIGQAEWARESEQMLADEHCTYLTGHGEIYAEEGKLHGGSSGRASMGKFPPSEKPGSPMKDLFWNGPFAGIELLPDPVGSTCNSGGNIGTPWGTESVRGESRLVSKTERIVLPVGEFSDCVLIETTISASNEASEEGSERNRYRDYWSGTRRAWFAPGVGLVRMLYQHRNGYETDIQLVEYSLAESSGDHLPLAIDNRWRYCWLDQGSGATFEDSLRVAAYGRGRWQIAFVTRASVDTPRPASE